MYSEGTLRGVSVGFVGGSKRPQAVGGRRAMVYAPGTCQLVEISCVPCPMNPRALLLPAGKSFDFAGWCDRDRIASLLSRGKAFGETMPAFVRKAFEPLAAPLVTRAADLTKVRRLTVNVVAAK
jgi:hypothetical protein